MLHERFLVRHIHIEDIYVKYQLNTLKLVSFLEECEHFFFTRILNKRPKKNRYFATLKSKTYKLLRLGIN